MIAPLGHVATLLAFVAALGAGIVSALVSKCLRRPLPAELMSIGEDGAIRPPLAAGVMSMSSGEGISIRPALAASVISTGDGNRRRRHPTGIRLAGALLDLTAVALTAAVVLLSWALLAGDFSLEYVADYTSRAMRWPYRLSSLWAGMAGSLLFWTWLLALHAVVAVRVTRRRAPELVPVGLAVLAGLIAAFTALLLGLADPFARLAMPALDGGGLTPVLEYSAMLYHPPILYVGYIGLAVPFALTVAALRFGRIDDAWLGLARRWTLVSWVLLSAGMLAGAHWAYVELGWGGFWAWDPVENASLLPWLAATAFLHAAVVQDKRKTAARVSTSGLCLLAFCLALLGAFLTRSGATGSVHAFAESRAIGRSLLGVVALAVVVSIGLLVRRRRLLRSGLEPRSGSLLSKGSALVANQVLLLSTCALVLVGTVFPLLTDIFAGDRVVVSGRFFALFSFPLALGALVLVGLAPLLRWRGSQLSELRRPLMAAAGSLAALGLALVTDHRDLLFLAVVGVGGASAALCLLQRAVATKVAHLGFVVLLVGVAGSTTGAHTARFLAPGESVWVGPYEVRNAGVSAGSTSRYRWVRAEVAVERPGRKGRVATLHPELRRYESSTRVQPEAALRSTPGEDILVALRQADAGSGGILVETFQIPLVTLVWWGGLLIIAGGAVALRRPLRTATPAAEDEQITIMTLPPAENLPSLAGGRRG